MLNYDAVVHEDDAVGRLAGEADLVSDDDHRHAPPASSRMTSSTSPTSSGSSAEVGSSNSMQLGLHRQRAGDGDALLLAAGELARVGVGLVGEADPVEQLLARSIAIARLARP